MLIGGQNVTVQAIDSRVFDDDGEVIDQPQMWRVSLPSSKERTFHVAIEDKDMLERLKAFLHTSQAKELFSDWTWTYIGKKTYYGAELYAYEVKYVTSQRKTAVIDFVRNAFVLCLSDKIKSQISKILPCEEPNYDMWKSMKARVQVIQWTNEVWNTEEARKKLPMFFIGEI